MLKLPKDATVENLKDAIATKTSVAPENVNTLYLSPRRGNYVFTLVVGSIMSVRPSVRPCVCVSVPL